MRMLLAALCLVHLVLADSSADPVVKRYDSMDDLKNSVDWQYAGMYVKTEVYMTDDGPILVLVPDDGSGAPRRKLKVLRRKMFPKLKKTAYF